MIEEEKTLPFQELSEIYSKDFYRVKSLSRADHLLSILSLENVTSNRAIDLGCGNGIASNRIASGMNTTILGVDISTNMLEHAQKIGDENPALSFVNMDITHLNFEEDSFDFAFSIFDVLNYLGEEQLDQFLVNMRKILTDNAFIALDFLTPLTFYDTDYNPDSIHEEDEFYYISKAHILGPNSVGLDLIAFIKDRNDLYRKIKERHLLHLFEEKHVVQALQKASFRTISSYDGEELKKTDKHSWHVILIAQK